MKSITATRYQFEMRSSRVSDLAVLMVWVPRFVGNQIEAGVKILKSGMHPCRGVF